MDEERKIQHTELFKISKNFRGRSAVVVQLWWIVQSTLFYMSPQFLYGWRRFLLRAFGAKVGRGVIIRPTARITYPWKLKIDDHAWIGDYAEIYNLADIHIEKRAVVSQYAYICTGSHDADAVGFDIFAKPIKICESSWIATGAFVHPGVTIGKYSVVSARSIVRKNTEEFGVYAGEPLRKIRDRRFKAAGGQ